MRKIIFITILAISFHSFSQDNSGKNIEKKTLEYFNAEQWKELINFGEENTQDYYFFNIRMGVAYFSERQYHSAEKYFKKAIKQQATEYAKEYLFWTYFNLGEIVLAEQVYDGLATETKRNIDYRKTAIESIYLEGGVKSPNTNEIENTYYGNIVLKHRLGKNIKVLHSVNLFLQNDGTQDFNSFQYHLSGTYYLETSAFSLGGIYSKSEFTYADSEEITGDFGNLLIQNSESASDGNTYSIYANYSRRFNRLRVNANFNYLTQNSTNKNFTKLYLKDDGSLISEDFNNYKTTETVYIPSIGAMYTPAFTKDRLSVGADIFIAITENDTNLIFKPYLNIFVTDQLWINTHYLQVKDHLFADYSSEILYNTPDLSVNRFVSTINYAFSKSIITKLTYTFENYDFTSVDLNYNINSIFLGIQYKF